MKIKKCPACNGKATSRLISDSFYVTCANYRICTIESYACSSRESEAIKLWNKHDPFKKDTAK